MPQKSAIVPEDEIPVYDENVKQHWGHLPTSEKPIYYSKTGIASKEGFQPTTLCQVLLKAAEQNGEDIALCIERDVGTLETLSKENGKYTVPPAKHHSEWESWTYNAYLRDVKLFAKACIKCELIPHDAVNIFGANSPEWSISMLGAIFAGGKAAGIYPSDTSEQLKFKCDHANGSIIAVDGQKNFDKLKSVIENLPYVKAIVSWGKLSDSSSLKNQLGKEVKVHTWQEFLKLGESVSDEDLNERINAQKPTQSCVYVYTSGTTGNPKAVMLSHDNVVFASYIVQFVGLGSDFGVEPVQQRVLSYLPLCHVAGMMVDIICPLVTVAYRPAYYTTFFARTYDLKTGALVERLQCVKPSVFLGVPRVWEKIVDKLRTGINSATGVKGMLARWALSTGNAYSTSLMSKPGVKHKPKSPGFFYKLADKLVLSKVRAKLGLECCKICITGAAPIHLETQDFMASFGLIIQEAYGLSETSAALTWNCPDLFRFGCVGPSFPACSVKLFAGDSDINSNVEVQAAENMFEAKESEQGEICVKGRQIMIGYMANERLGKEHVAEIKKKNAETIDKNGYMHTGDKGCKSKDGFFKITGRYKELIIGAGGENIAPVPIEDAIKGTCPIISNIVMIGDKRKFNVALVTLRQVGATGEFGGTDELEVSDFKYLNTESKTIQEAVKDDKIINEITEKMKAVNNDPKVVVSNAAKIQKFMILPRDLSIDKLDFTATLKLKRSFVTHKFEKVIDLMYGSKDVYVPFPMDKFAEYYK